MCVQLISHRERYNVKSDSGVRKCTRAETGPEQGIQGSGYDVVFVLIAVLP